MATTGVELATAYVSLTVDGSQVSRGVTKGLSSVGPQADRVGRDSGRRMGDRMSKGIVSSVGKIAGPLAAIFATVGIGKFISGTLDEAREAQKVSAVTDSIVKSTGGVAKVTAKQVGALSEALSKKIGVDDEAIQASANLLLTFKNVRNEAGKSNKVFDTAVGLAQDLSKAGFGSAEGAAKMLGKALNDPVKGITALGRAGVTFSEAQKKQIKDSVKNNDLLAAQKIILGEVKSQVGGVAEAAATTGEKVGVAFGNLKEKIGTAILPLLDRFGSWFLDKGLPAIERFGGGIKALANLLVNGDFTGALRDAFGWDEDSAQVDFLLKVRDVAMKVLAGLKVFGAYVKDELYPAISEGWKTIQPGLERAKTIIDDAFGEGGGGKALRDFGTLLVDKIIPFVAELVNVWLPIAARQFAIVKGVIEAAATAIGGYFQIQATVVRTVSGFIIDTFDTIATKAAEMLDALSNVPGFGWAKDAADKLRNVAGKADEVKDAINGIKSKSVTIAVDVKYSASGSGRFNNGGVGYAPGRATGGPVRKGQPYVVGEKRAELFVPDSNGKILPRVPVGAGAGGSGGSAADRYMMAGAIADALGGQPLAVDARDVTRAVNYRNSNRARG